MTKARVGLSVHGRKIAEIMATGGAAGAPLIVALHGGGYNSGCPRPGT